MTNRNYVDPAQEVWYISQTRKILVGRNNQPITQKLKLDYSITDRFNFSVINSINQIVNLGGYEYQAYVSWTNARKNRILLVYQGNYSITDNVITFVLDSYTQPYLDNITNNNGQECDIVISRKNNRYTEVVLRDKITCYPRSVIEGVTPITFVTNTVFDGAIPVSGSFGAGDGISLVPGETNSFAFGTDLVTANDNQFVIGEKNNQDATKLFIAANSGNVFSVDYEGNVEANTISASNLFVNGEEFSLSGIDEKFAATSGWANETFETKTDATSAFNSLSNEIQGVSDSLSTYATKAELPTKVSDLDNDSGFATTGYVDQQMSGLLITVDAAYENKTAAGQKFDYLSGQISNTNENIYQNYATKSEVPTKVSQLTNDEDFASKTYVGEKDQEVLGYVGNNYTTNATFNSSITNLTNSIGSVNSNLTANYALKTSVPTAVSQLTNDTGYITGVNLDPYALKSEIPTKVSELENDAEYITSADIPTVLNLSNKKKALIDREVKEYNFRIHYQEDVEVFVNWQDTKDGVLYISPIQHFDLEEGKQIEVEQFVKPVGEFTAVSGNGVQIADLPETFGEDKILVFKRFITNDNGVYKQFAKFEFEYSNEDVEQLIHEPLTFIALEDDTKIAFAETGSGTIINIPTLQYSINEGEWENYTIGDEITLNIGDQLSFQKTSDSANFSNSEDKIYSFVTSQGKFNVEGSIGSMTNSVALKQLFANNTGLVDASKLQLPVASGALFMQMFMKCTSLVGVPVLPATSVLRNGYLRMYQGCSSLQNIPENYLPATTLGDASYSSMFAQCRSLKNVCKLPATTLTNACYQYMFQGCTSLTEVPEDMLPATTLVANCYHTMFGDCTNLRNAPKLPATTLATNCYFQMFMNCTSLTELDVDFTSWGTSNSEYTRYWTTNIAALGTFKKTTSLPVIRGINNIPSGWLIENEDDLNFIAHGNVQIELKQIGSPSAIAMKYSTDGETFYDYTIGDVISLSAGQVVSFYNTTDRFGNSATDTYRFSMSGTGYVEVEGHIDALVNHTPGGSYNYFQLFQSCTKLLDASGLKFDNDTPQFASYCQMFNACSKLLYPPKTLPDTTTNFACQSMFQTCSSMIMAPELPAKKTYQSCYQNMFAWCTALTAVPNLPASSLAQSCYDSMFYGCTGIKSIPKNYLPVTSLVSNCYINMFRGCTSLTAIPEGLLPATTLATACYSQMFRGCTGLSTVPEDLLPAKTMRQSCYNLMFNSCIYLTNTPKLPATTLADSCYRFMFESCHSLTSTPDLPATNCITACYGSMFYDCYNLRDTGYIAASALAPSSCLNMFYGCTKLSSINVGFAEWDDIENATYNWVNGVAASGIFRKPSTLNRVEGPSNIPQGWEKLDNDGVTFICKDAPVEVALTQVGSPSAITMFYSVNGNDLQSYSVGTVVSLQPGQTVTFKGTTEHFSLNSNGSGLYRFTTTGDGFVDVEGNIQGLVNMREDVGNHMFTQLFGNCTRIQDASRLKLPATTAATYCYYWMFRNCTNLTGIPKLPAKTLAGSCYLGMFDGCTSLTEVPEDYLPVTTIAGNCYQQMFRGCTSLTAVPDLPATTIAANCYNGMFDGCTSLSSVPEDLLPATVMVIYCYAAMFQGCTSLTEAPKLPATTLATNCYYAMFNSCTHLLSTPNLPATTLAMGCYAHMFEYCSALTACSELPATELEYGCYDFMFNGCNLSGTPQIYLPATKLAATCYKGMFYNTKITDITLPAKLLLSRCYESMLNSCSRLSSITVGFTVWDEDENCTVNWLNGVAANGQFYCPTSLDTTTRDIHHIPSGWTIGGATRGGVVLNLTKGGLKGLQKGGFEEPEEEIEEEIEIPPYEQQERVSEFPDDENQDHVTGFIDPLPAPQIEEDEIEENEEYVLGDQPETPTPSRDEMR